MIGHGFKPLLTMHRPIQKKIRVSVGLNAGTGTAYFDGIQLEKGSVLSAYNLVENAGFEQKMDA